MIVVCNLPYGPWLHAANLSARREAMYKLMKDGRVAYVIQAYALGAHGAGRQAASPRGQRPGDSHG